MPVVLGALTIVFMLTSVAFAALWIVERKLGAVEQVVAQQTDEDEENSGNGEDSYDALEAPEEQLMILRAMEAIQREWEEIYQRDETNEDWYLEFKNTRVIYVAPNTEELFQDVTCIVEFELYTNMLNSTPYYSNGKYCDSVAFYKDGTLEVDYTNRFRAYSSATYQSQYPFVDRILDFGAQYNAIFNLRQ